MRDDIVEAAAQLEEGVADRLVLADVDDERLGVLDAHAEGREGAAEAADDVLGVLDGQAAAACAAAGGRVEHDDTPGRP